MWRIRGALLAVRAAICFSIVSFIEAGGSIAFILYAVDGRIPHFARRLVGTPRIWLFISSRERELFSSAIPPISVAERRTVAARRSRM